MSYANPNLGPYGLIALAGQIQARNEVASNLLLAPIQGNVDFISVNGLIQGETEEELLLSTRYEDTASLSRSEFS